MNQQWKRLPSELFGLSFECFIILDFIGSLLHDDDEEEAASDTNKTHNRFKSEGNIMTIIQ